MDLVNATLSFCLAFLLEGTFPGGAGPGCVGESALVGFTVVICCHSLPWVTMGAVQPEPWVTVCHASKVSTWQAVKLLRILRVMPLGRIREAQFNFHLPTPGRFSKWKNFTSATLAYLGESSNSVATGKVQRLTLMIFHLDYSKEIFQCDSSRWPSLMRRKGNP